jgi:hypothetical protein
MSARPAARFIKKASVPPEYSASMKDGRKIGQTRELKKNVNFPAAFREHMNVHSYILVITADRKPC